MHKITLYVAMAIWGFAAMAGEVTIVALGDSLVQGYGLARGDGLVPRMQEWMTRHGADVRLINAGVSGDTTAGGAARVAWTLSADVDVDVDAMIVVLGGNDMLRGIEPAVARANLDAILQAARAARVPVLLVGMHAPGNYGPDYKAEFDRVYPELAARHHTLFAPDFFAGLGGGGTDPGTVRDLMQPDGIHPNARGVARIVAALAPHVLALAERARTRR